MSWQFSSWQWGFRLKTPKVVFFDEQKKEISSFIVMNLMFKFSSRAVFNFPAISVYKF